MKSGYTSAPGRLKGRRQITNVLVLGVGITEFDVGDLDPCAPLPIWHDTDLVLAVSSR